MKDEDRRKLQEGFLGEVWHVWNGEKDAANYAVCSCGKILKLEESGKFSCSKNRTFDKWNDFGALWTKIMLLDREQFNKFLNFIFNQIENTSFSAVDPNYGCRFYDEAFTKWMVDKDRFPELVLKAIRKGVLK